MIQSCGDNQKKGIQSPLDGKFVPKLKLTQKAISKFSGVQGGSCGNT
jgi:hypothetical protein